MFGCWRCNLKHIELLDALLNSYNHIRSYFHFLKMDNQYEKNVSKMEFRKQTGYSSLYYKSCQIKYVSNIHAMSAVDINHDVKNKVEQLDKCIKKCHLAPSCVCTSIQTKYFHSDYKYTHLQISNISYTGSST